MVLIYLHWLEGSLLEKCLSCVFLQLHNVILRASRIFLFFNPYIIQFRDELQNPNIPQYFFANSNDLCSSWVSGCRITIMQYGPQHRMNIPRISTNSFVLSIDIFKLRMESLFLKTYFLSFFLEFKIWNVMTTTLINRTQEMISDVT